MHRGLGRIPLTRALRWVAPASLLLSLTLVATAQEQRHPHAHGHSHSHTHGFDPFPSTIVEFDRRPIASHRQPWLQASEAALAELDATILGDVHADWSARFETPVFIRSTTSTLTGSAPGEHPLGIVRGFVGAHPGLFRMQPDELDRARVIRDAQSTPDGIRSLILGQSVNGIPLLGCDLRAALTPDGRIVSIGSTMLDLGSPALQIGMALSPIDAALREASLAIGAPAQQFDQINTELRTRQAPALPEFEHFSAEAVYVPVSRDRIEPGHRLELRLEGAPDLFEVITIGDDPEPIILRNLTRYAGGATSVAATYRIHPGESPTPMTPAAPVPNGDQPMEQSRVLVSLASLNAVASPLGWVDPALMTTIGNNIIAQADFNANNGADNIRPDAGAGLIFDFPFDSSSDPASNIDAAITQAFYTGNRVHDILYGYGFTEGFGAYQQSNFGRGGVERDPIQIDVQDSGAANNARFISSGADGSPGRIELFLWTGTEPARDGALDNHIVVHEMAHGLTERLLLGIEGTQGRSMGEGWSDYFALSLLSDPAADNSKTFPFAPYVAHSAGDAPFGDNYYFGLRRFPYSTDQSINPLTFQDIDPSRFSTPEDVPISPIVAPGNPGRIHQVGEVWCSILWECRAAIIASEGPAGSTMFDQLVVDALKVMTTSEPDFVMARDAILIADLITNDGAHLCDLWDAFARRGLGVGAFSPSSDLGGVIESFETPAAPRLIDITAPGDVLLPGSGDVYLLGVDPGCAATGSFGAPTLRVSINGGAFQARSGVEVAPGQYEFPFPLLLCGDEVRYYSELDTPGGVISHPPAGPAAPFTAIVAIDPALSVIRSEDREPFDFFGYDIDIDDGVILVGSWQDDDTAFNSGAAYLFEPDGFDTASNSTWSQRAKLIPPTNEHSISFGFRVSLSGDLAAVSAIRDSTRAPGAGAVYMHRKGDDGWPLEGMLTALDGEPNDGFGSGLSISPDGTVYVGSFRNDTAGSNAGALYIYENQAEAGVDGWTQLRRILAEDAKPGDHFGEAVVANDQYVIVGAPGISTDTGAVYCYRRTGPNAWTLEQRIMSNEPVTGALFGASLDLDGDRIIVGAPGDTDFFQNVGAAYLFKRDAEGSWNLEDKVSTPSQRGLDEFGRAVTLEGDLAVVTALRTDHFADDAGGAFAFERTAEGWRFQQDIAPQMLRDRIQFGSSAAIDQGVAAIGSWLDGEDRSATGSVSLYRPVALDCDANGLPDLCDIAAGDLVDQNQDNLADACVCVGDLNGDLRIDTSDLGLLITRFGTQNDLADLNADGVVDQTDLGMMIQGYGLLCIDVD